MKTKDLYTNLRSLRMLQLDEEIKKGDLQYCEPFIINGKPEPDSFTLDKHIFKCECKGDPWAGKTVRIVKQTNNPSGVLSGNNFFRRLSIFQKILRFLGKEY